MTYKFIGSERDIPLLTKLGYKNDILGSDEEIKIDYDGDVVKFSGIKTFDDENIAVAFSNDDRPVRVYKYEGGSNSHHAIREITNLDALPYLQDLIDENLIRKVKDK